MPKSKPARSQPPVSALVVARRYARASREVAMNPDDASLYGPAQGVGYAVQKKDAADQLAVYVRRPSVSAVGFIGHLNLESGDWRLYPEFIQRDERAAMAKLAKSLGHKASDQMLDAAAKAESEAVDGLHPITKRVRGEMAALLASLPLQDIMRNGLTETDRAQARVSIDDFTSYHPSIGIGVHGPTHLLGTDAKLERSDFEIVPGEAFRLCFMGTRHEFSDGRKLRGTAKVTVADLSPDGIWVPREEVVGDSWEALSQVPAILGDYSRQFSAFSASACAVAHNVDRPI